MSLREAAVLATESAEHGSAPVPPYAIGGIVLAILLFMIVALLMFGAGREHS